MDWQTAVIAIGGPFVAAISGFAVWFFQSRLEAIRRERERLQDERKRVYLILLEPIIRLWAGIKTPSENEAALEQVLSFEYRQIMFEVNLMGSDEVVKSYNELMQSMYRQNINPQELLLKLGSLLLAIRKDLGIRKTKLKPVDMMTSQISDIDQMMQP